MVKYIIQRPVAVLVSTFALLCLGVYTFNKIPVSLLPEIDVPEITVQIQQPSQSARDIHSYTLRMVKNQLQQVSHLSDLEAKAQNGMGTIKLKFGFGTRLDLAFIEVNEKIDAIVGRLPKDMPRPRVVKAGASDIPVFNINVFEKKNNSFQSNSDFLALSDFCNHILRRRIEQLPEVGLVDITGTSSQQVIILPEIAKIQSLGINENMLAMLLQKENQALGNLTVKDGQYMYNIRFSDVLKSKEDIENIYLKIGQRILKLKEIATVKWVEKPAKGYSYFNGKRCVSMAIIKQSDAQLLELRKQLNSLTLKLGQEYPQLSFSISQDQTELLDVAINNLIANLIFGALCTFLMVFFFMNELKTPFVIGIVIPVALLATFLAFYFLKISINIVSLAGLVLGMGEIIDSAIIVIENIEQKREEGYNLLDACTEGTEEVIKPLFTSILTNSAVFLPLIFLSGLAGALFYDQALSVTLALFISLFCSYTLVPVLYRLFHLKQPVFQQKAATRTMLWAVKVYDILFDFAFRFKKTMLLFFVVLLLGLVPTLHFISKQGMPSISRDELQINIDWNEALTLEENQKRTQSILNKIHQPYQYVVSYIGWQDFILNRELQNNTNEATLFLKVMHSADYKYFEKNFQETFRKEYPIANIETKPSKNIFEQLFGNQEAEITMKVFDKNTNDVPSVVQLQSLQTDLKQHQLTTNAVPFHKGIVLHFNKEKMVLYQVAENDLMLKLKTLLNDNFVGNLSGQTNQVPMLLGNNNTLTFENILATQTVKNTQGQDVMLNEMVEFSIQNDLKTFFQNKEGGYFAFDFGEKNISEKVSLMNQTVARFPELGVSFSGKFFTNKALTNELLMVLLVAIALLYFILTAQFESLLQPLIVMLTIAFGITGALMTLWLAGNSLNIMSGIGLIVLIGILDNDSILKIDTMNKSRNQLDLVLAIKNSGKKRLKSQLMTFLTTILGLLPVLFSGGLGSELQQPLALSVIGGMCVGLLISITFIPLIYWFIYARKVG
ncbi:MAG: efflux RND transporter permease subunit [Pseudarcicella sp.]|nr:efflux RND transporter permease subunit [Pseudarcicella sp.]